MDKSIPNVQKYGTKGDLKAIDDNNKIVQSYQIWQKMMQRCYDTNFHKNNPTYSDITVCEEWMLHENFKKWTESSVAVGFAVAVTVSVSVSDLAGGDTVENAAG